MYASRHNYFGALSLIQYTTFFTVLDLRDCPHTFTFGRKRKNHRLHKIFFLQFFNFLLIVY